MYRAEGAATPDEARATMDEARTNPDMARRLLITMYALGGEDREFAQLLDLVIKVGVMQLIAIKVHEDDDFALKMAELITDAMAEMKPGAAIPRGKPKTTRTA